MTISARTGELWCAVNERDEIGDNTPFEYATHVTEARLRLALVHIGGAPGSAHAGQREDLRDKVTVPDVFMQAHSAPLQMTLLPGRRLSRGYKGSAFGTMHGLVEPRPRHGPTKVVRLIFDAKRQAHGRVRGLHDGFVVSDSQGVGPAGRCDRREGRVDLL